MQIVVICCFTINVLFGINGDNISQIIINEILFSLNIIPSNNLSEFVSNVHKNFGVGGCIAEKHL